MSETRYSGSPFLFLFPNGKAHLQSLPVTSPIYQWSTAEDGFSRPLTGCLLPCLVTKLPAAILSHFICTLSCKCKELTRLRLNSPQTFREVNCCDPTHKRERKCTYPMSLQASLLAAAQLSFTHERNGPATKHLFQLFLLYSYYCSVFSKPQLCKTLQLPGPDPHQL